MVLVPLSTPPAPPLRGRGPRPAEQAYVVVAQQGPPQSYPAYGMDARAPQPQYRQVPPAAMAPQAMAAGSPSDTLMLEPPPVFERLDSKAIVGMLRGAGRAAGARTFRSRGGAVAQVCQEFHAVIAAARQVAAQAGEDPHAQDAGPRGHHLQQQQPQHRSSSSSSSRSSSSSSSSSSSRCQCSRSRANSTAGSRPGCGPALAGATWAATGRAGATATEPWATGHRRPCPATARRACTATPWAAT
ncbi:unnamed protein product [Prorocentrum cordatum]|uniref:Uncharacterized protein n=1 Tax=Prorocentrum cordatum TaxID=2364126 RepID=A0ABN9XF70_9DINO|nr:unnamed protein product [Polarella glacialis]